MIHVAKKEMITLGARESSHLLGMSMEQRMDCPMVIMADVSNFSVKKILIDNGSSANIIFLSTLRRIGMEAGKLILVRKPLVGFGGAEVMPKNEILLTTSLGTSSARKMALVSYLVVDASFVYNALLGRPTLNDFRATVSSFHLKMKFSADVGI